MQQQIRGWRFAAERIPKRRVMRDGPLAHSARTLVSACQELGDRARGMSAPTHGRMSAAQAMAARMPARVAEYMPGRTPTGMMGRMPARMAARMPGQMMGRRPTRMPARMARRMSGRMAGRMTMPTAMPTGMTSNMKRVAGGLGLLAAGMGVARWAINRPSARERELKNRWIMVTVNCSPQRLASRADLPEPITRLGDAVDIKIAPAPGDRGTELGARLRDLPRTKVAGMVHRHPEEDPRRMVEQALRDAKAIIETGEVLRGEWPAAAQAAQAGKLLEFAGRRGGRQ
ncbi:hypothetical protein Airi02_104080 [Actinoallomurus iriomotensis]|uniref:Uncharacterized protein n=2 Tax=Actinoallomurus iriomotensis TaxID=478107 RepID=A0A9W6W5W1_9ACTN|nr:hypothetical protein Airi02_104080 [Actinoallomurus iriomotensis]